MNKALEKIRDEMAVDHCDKFGDRLQCSQYSFQKGFDAGAKAASQMYEERLKEAVEALELWQKAYPKDTHEHFATGPVTGNVVEDLLSCPGCDADGATDTTLNRLKGQKHED